MGYMRHNAIVVTSWDADALSKAADKAKELGLQVLGPSEEVMNGYTSMLVCPDGSKEGWDESAQGDERRTEFRKYMVGTRHAYGSGPLEWAEVEYGNDGDAAEVVASSWPCAAEDAQDGR